MKKNILYIIFIIQISICFSEGSYTEWKLIAKIDNTYSNSSVKNLLLSNGFYLNQILCKNLNIWLIDVSKIKFNTTVYALNDLRKLSFIIYAQLDHLVEEREIPNDPLFTNMWHLNNTGQSGGIIDADIDALEAWDISTGGENIEGDRIVVAIIDSGFDFNHEDLIDNVWNNDNEIPNNGIDDDYNGYIDDINGWNAYDNNGNINSSSHGTKVAGVIGARGNNDIDVVGINWDVDLMLIPGSSSSTSTVILAYSYALDNKILWNDTEGELGANVVVTNSSFGINYADCNSDPYPVWNDIYNAMGEVGILSVAATMNYYEVNVDEQGDVPTGCNSDYLITVTNTTYYDEKISGAGYGLESIDLGAPGYYICSTTVSNGTSCSLTGTSYSSPVVAGSVALVHSSMSQNLLNEYIFNPSTTSLIIKEIILSTVDTLDALIDLTLTGGRLNLYNAVLIANQYNAFMGDLNNDNNIDILDVLLIVQCILFLECNVVDNQNMDLNEDNDISINDIIFIVNIILDN